MIPVLSFSFLSFLISNERTTNWLFLLLSEEIGYVSEINFSSINWSAFKSCISLNDIRIVEKNKDKPNSIYAENIDLEINLLNLIQLKNFLEIKIEETIFNFEKFDLNKEISSNRAFEFLAKKSRIEFKEVKIKGSLEEIDLTKYFYLFSNTSGNKEIPKLLIPDVLISKIKLGPLVFLDTNLMMESFQEGLRFDLINEFLKGSIYVNKPIKEGLEIKLSFLKVNNLVEQLDSSSNLFTYLLDHLEIPISLSIDKITLGDKDYGQWKFLINKRGNTLFFEQIYGTYKNFFVGENSFNSIFIEPQLKIDPKIVLNINVPNHTYNESNQTFLSISRQNQRISTNFQGKMSTDNLTQSLLNYGEADTEKSFLAGATHLIFDLNWLGFPNQFEFKEVTGSLSFRIDDFLIKGGESEILGSSDFLKLISLFNVSNTFGDLTNLNFRDKFKAGFQADRVEGGLEIDREQIKTNESIVFSSGSGEFKWYGHIGKSKEGNLKNLDFEIVITLPLREYLPAYALILGGPLTAGIVYIAGKAFKKPLNKLSTGRWKVSGPIENPKTEFLEWFEK